MNYVSSLPGSIENIIVREGYCVVVDERLFKSSKKIRAEVSTLESSDKKKEVQQLRYERKGMMSKNVRANLTRALRLLINGLKYGNTHRQPTFVTLTLPARQKTTDKQCNVRLSEWIKELKSKSNVKHYVWRAEKQKNGNIHYHVLVDSYVKWQLIQELWNRVIERDGYVSDYRANNNKSKKESPNSTDIHSLKKVHDAIAYISKYMAKLNDSEEVAVQAHIWGCSDSLRDLKEPQIYINKAIDNEIRAAAKEVIRKEGFTLLKLKVNWKNTPSIQRALAKEYEIIYRRLYTNNKGLIQASVTRHISAVVPIKVHLPYTRLSYTGQLFDRSNATPCHQHKCLACPGITL